MALLTSLGKCRQTCNCWKSCWVAGGYLQSVKALTKATQAFIAFNDKMTQSLQLWIQLSSNKKQWKLQDLLYQETRISAEQSAEAFFFLASAGLNAEQSISALPQVAKFAQAGMFDMATATDLATDAQSALGLTVDDATKLRKLNKSY